MIEKTREVIELEYRWMKRFARILLLVVIAFPLFQYGPLLWKDGSYGGRWNFAANMEPQPIECKAFIYFLQSCELKFAERTEGRSMTIHYLLIGGDWSNAVPDIIRSSNGHYSSTIATSMPGLLSRAGALFSLALIGFCIEKLVLALIWRSMVSQLPVVATTAQRSSETVSLSRDRRDHM